MSVVTNVRMIAIIHGRGSSGGCRCLQEPLVLGAPGIRECVEAWQTSVTPVSCHTWLTAAPSRAVTSSAKRTYDRQGGARKEEEEIYYLYGIGKQSSPYGSPINFK